MRGRYTSSNTPVSRRLLGLLAVTVGLAFAPAPGAMETVKWLYEVRVPVADQSADARRDAARLGLLEVLSRVSGLADVPLDSEMIAAAYDAPERYYSRYSYASEWIDDARQSFVVLQFAPAAIQRLARDGGLPIWSSRRPTVVAFVAHESTGEREVNRFEAAVLRAVEAQAQARGLPLQLPEATPPARLVQDGANSAVALHAERLGANALLVGQLSEVGTLVRGRFELRPDVLSEEVRSFATSGESAEAVLARAVHRVSDVLAQRLAVRGGDAGQVLLRVAGLADVGAYADLLRYLGSLEYLTDVHVVRAEATRIDVLVETAAEEARLHELLATEGRLVLEETSGFEFEPVLSWRG